MGCWGVPTPPRSGALTLNHIRRSPSESPPTPSDRAIPRWTGACQTAKVASADAAGRAAFVGRARERERVWSVLQAARDGRMTALLVSGDAGIGKTRLVGHVCADAADAGLLVMGGVCLPMGATTVPLMPLRTAFRRLPEGVSPPALDGEVHSGGAPVAVDAWLDRICRDRAVVLVVDDVQWADEASLDVLTYVLAGPSDRDLAVLLTLRRDEVGVGHPVQRWLADVRRMPCLTEVRLGPFDRVETSDQLKALLGAPPHESLVTQVQARTGGNAYLNRLIVEGLPADTRVLPPGLPEDLRSAVLRPWERLSRPARELVLSIAIGGEVAAGSALDRAADLWAPHPTTFPGSCARRSTPGCSKCLPTAATGSTTRSRPRRWSHCSLRTNGDGCTHTWLEPVRQG